MASTFSTSLKLELIGNGDQSGTWGTTTNTNLGTLLEQAITGVVAITMANADKTLTNLNGTSDEARNAVLVVGGTNSAIRNIIAPAVNKTYIVVNNTVGGFAIIIKTSASIGVSIANGATQTVYCDGTEFYIASFPSTGGTITGNLAVTGNLTVSTNASVTGTLNVTGIPTIPTAVAGTNTTQAASTAFVSSAITTATGSLGTMSTQNANNVAITGGTATLNSLGVTGGVVSYNVDGAGYAYRLTPTVAGTGSIIQWTNYAQNSQWTNLTGTNGNLDCSTSFSALSFSGAGTNLTGTANSLNAGLGVNQSYQDVTSSRTNNTTYTNSTGKPIYVSVFAGGAGHLYGYVNGQLITQSYFPNTNTNTNIYFIVPAGSTYLVNATNGVSQWTELR